MKRLIIGFGNPDRQDDGVAWHILSRLAKRLGQDFPLSYEECEGVVGSNPSFLFQLQLTPELAEVIAEYDHVCFVDAHTGAYPGDISIKQIEGTYTASPLTHHLTPEKLVALAYTLYHIYPKAILFSVRGNQFGFTQSLSEEADRLADTSIDLLMRWLKDPHTLPINPII